MAVKQSMKRSHCPVHDHVERSVSGAEGLLVAHVTQTRILVLLSRELQVCCTYVQVHAYTSMVLSHMHCKLSRVREVHV